MRAATLGLAVLVGTVVALSGQQVRDVPRTALTGTAQIIGRVRTADQTPEPVRRASVVLTGDQLPERLVVVTDDAGAFEFKNLPADRYSLAVSKAGFVPANYGSKRPGGAGTPIVVLADQRARVEMNLIRGSVITGTVRDGLGRPLPAATVTVQRYAVSFDTGERMLQSVTTGSAGQMVDGFAPEAFPGTAVTDDRGAYRIYGLAAGEYVVSASTRPPISSSLTSTDVYQITAADLQRAQQIVRSANTGAAGDPSAGPPNISASSLSPSPRVDYVPVYHPAAIAREDAATIALGPSEERNGVDVLLRLVPTARVFGTVTAPDGSPLSGAQVSVMDPLASNTRVFRTTRSTEDGEFMRPSSPPGRYQVQASTYPAGFTGMTEIMVEGRDISAPFVLSPGVSVSGRIVFDGKTPAPVPTTGFVFLRRQPWALSNPAYEILPDGRFVISKVSPGSYRLALPGRPPAGWILRSAMVNGVDASDIPIDIKSGQNIDGVVVTLTDRPAEISGLLQTATGAPAPDYVLIVFSSDPRFWVPRTRRTQQVRPDLNGRFIARDLPAGDYLIAAVTDVEDGQWNDRQFLAALAASSPIAIALAEGEKRVQNIRIGGR